MSVDVGCNSRIAVKDVEIEFGAIVKENLFSCNLIIFSYR